MFSEDTEVNSIITHMSNCRCIAPAYMLPSSRKKETGETGKVVLALGLHFRQPQNLNLLRDRMIVTTRYDHLVFRGIDIFKNVTVDLGCMEHVQVFERLEFTWVNDIVIKKKTPERKEEGNILLRRNTSTRVLLV